MKVSSSTKGFVAGMVVLVVIAVAAIPQANRKAVIVQKEFESIPLPADTVSISTRENHKPGAAFRSSTLNSTKRPEELWDFYKRELANLGWFLCEQKSVERSNENRWVAVYCKNDLEARVELPRERYVSGQLSYSVSVSWSWRIP